MNRYYGKYRGQVVRNIDPQNMGRVQVKCAAVLGEGTMSWAMPCSPYAGSGVGFFAVPPVGANVWVEFEGGDPNSPILGGCFWGLGEPPAMPALPTTKMLKTDSVTVTLGDLPGPLGGLIIEVAPPVVALPVSIKCDLNGIEIKTGTSVIKLDGLKVSVNNGGLEVT